jgi:molybdate transport system substrate-binding protein
VVFSVRLVTRWLSLLIVSVAAMATARGEEILVFAAASLTESLHELGRSFEKTTGNSVRFSFGASSDLARQIRAGAPADVYFSADTARMDELERDGRVAKRDRREFLSNSLVVVVPAASSLRIREPRDLLSLSRIALADPAVVPAGVYAKKWLEAEGLWERLSARVVPTLDVRSALAAVETQAAPVGIVYKTDACVSRRVRVVYEVAGKPEIVYSLARVGDSRKTAAADFVRFLESSQAAAVFEQHGFVVRTAN